MNEGFAIDDAIVFFYRLQKNKREHTGKASHGVYHYGQWRVASYLTPGSDKTADLAAYSFQFKSNRTVDALKNGILEMSGTWKDDQANRTIFSNFNLASYPLVLLNATWTITDGSETTVTATATVNGEFRNLRLAKN